MYHRMTVVMTIVLVAAIMAACNGGGSTTAPSDVATMLAKTAEAILTATAAGKVTPEPSQTPTHQPTPPPVATPVPTTPFAQPTVIPTLIVQPSEAYISVKSALEDYYALIQQGQYLIAWAMVEEFNQKQGTTYDAFVSGWQASGPAVIAKPFDYPDSGNTATVRLVLNYPQKNVTHTLSYDLIRDPSRGNSRFGYWIFVHGTFVN